MNEEIFSSLSHALEKYFDRDIKTTNLEHFKEWLIQEIIKLLMNDMEKLLNILYRMDVNEKKVKATFAQNDPQLIAPILAELIIEREIEKVETRRIYR